MENGRKVRQSEAEEAQARIANAAKDMERSGEIVLLRGEEGAIS